MPSPQYERVNEDSNHNHVIHRMARSEPSKKDVSSAIEAIEEYEKYLQSVDIEAIKKNVASYLEEREREREIRRAEYQEREKND